MKVLKWLLVLVGVAALIGTIVYTYLGWLDLQRLIAAAESMRSAPQPNPGQEIVIAISLALASGLGIGFGLGMPRRTAGRIRKETLESSAAAREADIRQRAAGGSGGVASGGAAGSGGAGGAGGSGGADGAGGPAGPADPGRQG